jgi:GGDEF domain-containing protein
MEYYCCKNIGCDLLQGYLVQKPTMAVEDIRQRYDGIDTLRTSDRRAENRGYAVMIQGEIDAIDPAAVHAEPDQLIEIFRSNPGRSIIPVIGGNQEPLGIVRPESVEQPPHRGPGLSSVPAHGRQRSIADIMKSIPVVDVHTPIDGILERFSGGGNLEGVLVTRNMRYIGFLSAASLIRIINEKKLAQATEQNPLSKLPGRKMIYEYLSGILHDAGAPVVVVHFDFDRFNIYNEAYGFRQGDRIILLFAEMLEKHAQPANRFAGHMGGDDFFMGVRGELMDDLVGDIRSLRQKFQSDARSFYDAGAIARGWIERRGSEGRSERCPLLTLSAAVLELSLPPQHFYTPAKISRMMDAMLCKAKRMPGGIHTGRLNTRDRDDARRLLDAATAA